MIAEHVEIAKGTRFRGHGHDRAHIFALTSGVYEERAGDRYTEFGAGQVRYSPPGDEHDIVFSQQCSGFVIILDDPPDTKCHPHQRVTPTPAMTVRELNQFAQVANLQEPTATLDRRLAVSEMIHTSARWARGDQTMIPQWLETARSIIGERPRQVSNGRALEHVIGFHPVYIARQFRRYYGYSPSTYSRQMRVRKAASLLSQTADTLNQVALESGYSDQSHLSRDIQRHFGCTPALLRLKHSISTK